MRAKDLDKLLASIKKAKPTKLRGDLLAAGVELALEGFPAEAVAVFEAAARHDKHPHESVFFAAAVHGLRVALGLETSAAAKKLALEANARVRADLGVDRWSQLPAPKPLKGLPPEKLDIDGMNEWFRRALQVVDEPRGVEILRALVARPDLTKFLQREASLLLADGLARADDAAGAVEALAKWRESGPSFPEQALALVSLAALIARNALRSRSQLDQKSVTAFAKALIALEPTEAEAASTHAIDTSYNQFYLEPRESGPANVGEDPARGYAVTGESVVLFTPTETESVEVSIKFGAPAEKDAKKAAKSLHFKLPVSGDLYLRNVEDAANDRRFAVPPGKYDVTALFFKKKAGKGMDRYDVHLYFAGVSGDEKRPSKVAKRPAKRKE